MSAAVNPDEFSRRERQVMDAVFRLGQCTAEEILGELPDPPTNSAIRSTLRILVEKGHLKHERRGRSYVYRSAARAGAAQRSALRRVVDTFFEGSTSRAMAALLRDGPGKLDRADIDQLQELIDRAREEGR